MKALKFLGSSLADLQSFPDSVRRALGHQLFLVQDGRPPDDYKPFATVGAGVYEIRVQVAGQWRVMYVAKFAEAVYVLHAFQKKTPKTSKVDMAIATRRFSQLMQERKE